MSSQPQAADHRSKRRTPTRSPSSDGDGNNNNSGSESDTSNDQQQPIVHVTTIAEMRQFRVSPLCCAASTGENNGATTTTVGLVPTMGCLHQGHLSLIHAAASMCDVVVLTIFANPTQMQSSKDYEAYPKSLDRDLEFCASEGAPVDCIWTPSVDDMYGGDVLLLLDQHRSQSGSEETDTENKDGDGDEGQKVVTLSCTHFHIEGDLNPRLFTGITTIVTKLFNVVQPTHAYFGQKDLFQVALVRKLVKTLCYPVKLVACPTMRERSGLALSSRNRTLHEFDRLHTAPALFDSVLAAIDTFRFDILFPLVGEVRSGTNNVPTLCASSSSSFCFSSEMELLHCLSAELQALATKLQDEIQGHFVSFAAKSAIAAATAGTKQHQAQQLAFGSDDVTETGHSFGLQYVDVSWRTTMDSVCAPFLFAVSTPNAVTTTSADGKKTMSMKRVLPIEHRVALIKTSIDDALRAKNAKQRDGEDEKKPSGAPASNSSVFPISDESFGRAVFGRAIELSIDQWVVSIAAILKRGKHRVTRLTDCVFLVFYDKTRASAGAK